MLSTRTWWTIIFTLLVLIVVLLGFLLAVPAKKQSAETTQPAESSASSGKPSTSEPSPALNGEAPLSSEVVVTSPAARSHVSGSFTIAGVAPGEWFFEGQFPVQVRDTAGNVIGRATANAQGDWMTDKLVTFTTQLQLDATYRGSAKLILLKNNPSGLPENDDALEVPIIVD